jgi:hypothetical protein
MRNIPLPLHARIIGPAPTARLLQSPAFPDGEADGSGMVPIASWRGELEGPPGSFHWINGHVRATIVEVLPLLPLPDPATVPDDQSCCMPVKLRWQRCGFPGWTIVDSDSGLCIPSNERHEVQILVPPNWILLPSDFQVGEGFLWQLAEVWCTACPLPIGHTRGSRLTWFGNLVPDEAVLRPRRAKTLQAFGPTIAGSQFTLYNGDPASVGAVPTGVLSINGGFVNSPALIGAASHLVITAGGGVGPLQFSWEID